MIIVKYNNSIIFNSIITNVHHSHYIYTANVNTSPLVAMYELYKSFSNNLKLHDVWQLKQQVPIVCVA